MHKDTCRSTFTPTTTETQLTVPPKKNGEIVVCSAVVVNIMKRQNDRTLKEELPRSVGAPYATGEITPERMKKQPKRKQRPVVDVTGDRSKV